VRRGAVPPVNMAQNNSVEVADIFRRYGQTYRQNHPLPLGHLKVMQAIEQCRTAALGGHLEECDHCGHQRPAYNSCRNRHCPKFQYLAKARWLEARQAELLPVNYCHNVFTLPHELNPLILCNERVLLNLLSSQILNPPYYPPTINFFLFNFPQMNMKKLLDSIRHEFILPSMNFK